MNCILCGEPLIDGQGKGRRKYCIDCQYEVRKAYEKKQKREAYLRKKALKNEI